MIKIGGPVYSDNGTEVTLRLYMFNYTGMFYAKFTGAVNLTIDGKQVVKLNDMWGQISDVENKNQIIDKSGNVGSSGPMMFNGESIGTAQFCNVKRGQRIGQDAAWTTVVLKLSFNNSFSYRSHTIRVEGTWLDRSESYNQQPRAFKLPIVINGFIYPKDFDVKKQDNQMVFSWSIDGDANAKKDGLWVLYRKSKGSSDFTKVGSTNVGNERITIDCRQFVCDATYNLTFKPSGFSEKPEIEGLTATRPSEHNINEGICSICDHSFFRYTTSDGKQVNLSSSKDFGAKIVSHTDDGKGNFTIEFDGNISRIPDNAFYSTKIKGNLVIPRTVTSIGASAFASCINLNGPLTIPDNVTEIGDQAFFYCYGFNGDLRLPRNLTRIGNKAFNLCSNLTGSLTIPEGVTEIGDEAFSGCGGFNGELSLPRNLTRIGNKAFNLCSNLSGSLTIPEGVTEIGAGVFSDCSGFNGNLTLPNNLTKIGNKAFYNCKGFTGSLTFPEGVTEIGENAFRNCTGFTGDFVLPPTLKSIGIYAFYNTQTTNYLVFQSIPNGMTNGYYKCEMSRCANLSDASYVADIGFAGWMNEISYVRTMTNTWGTLVLPFSMKLPLNAPYSVFTIETMTDNEVVLKRETTALSMGCAYIVRRNGEEKTLKFSTSGKNLDATISPEAVGNNLKFKGTYQAKEVTDGYILAKDLFWNVAKLKETAPETQAVMVGPFRCWLEGTTTNASPNLSMRIGDSTTGIDNVAPLEMLNANDTEYYDLNGKRLDAPMKGVNIMKRGNKTMKVIIK